MISDFSELFSKLQYETESYVRVITAASDSSLSALYRMIPQLFTFNGTDGDSKANPRPGCGTECPRLPLGTDSRPHE